MGATSYSQVVTLIQQLPPTDLLRLRNTVNKVLKNRTRVTSGQMISKTETDKDKLYQTTRELMGIFDDPVVDASTTIDDVLYGEQGDWRGSDT